MRACRTSMALSELLTCTTLLPPRYRRRMEKGASGLVAVPALRSLVLSAAAGDLDSVSFEFCTDRTVCDLSVAEFFWALVGSSS